MCRSADTRFFDYVDRDKLKIRAFCVRLILAKPCTSNTSRQHQQRLLPDSLTLVYLPRINGSPLEVDGSKIRPDSPAFVTLHRVVSSSSGDAVAYVSKERVRASEGVRYELCLCDVKLLKGVFRRSEEEDEWSMGCKCLLEEEMVGVKVVECEVCVAVEGRVVVCERVEMVVRRRRRKVRGMEEIPEAIEEEEKEEEECCCCCCGAEEESGGDGELTTAEVEGVGWAVDVGLWVLCLGVGLLISKASSRRLRRRKLF